MKQVIIALALVLTACGRRAEKSIDSSDPVVRPAKALAASKGQKIYEIGGDVVPPRRVSEFEPVISPEIKGRRITQAIFTYEIVVSAEGNVASVVLKSASQKGEPYEALERAYREALARCKFRPATRNGAPVAVRMMMLTRTEVR